MSAAAGAVRRQAALVLLLAGFGSALGLRLVLGGAGGGRGGGGADRAAGSGAAFAVALLALALASGWRPGRVRLRPITVGVAGAAVLCLPALVRHGGVVGTAGSLGLLAGWAPLVVAVAAAEEIFLRGVLFDALEAWAGPAVAVAATSTLFALLHLPLYGPAALPVDAAAGVWLGCLRVTTGGVAAPATAHAAADVAAWWLW